MCTARTRLDELACEGAGRDRCTRMAIAGLCTVLEGPGERTWIVSRRDSRTFMARATHGAGRRALRKCVEGGRRGKGGDWDRREDLGMMSVWMADGTRRMEDDITP